MFLKEEIEKTRRKNYVKSDSSQNPWGLPKHQGSESLAICGKLNKLCLRYLLSLIVNQDRYPLWPFFLHFYYTLSRIPICSHQTPLIHRSFEVLALTEMVLIVKSPTSGGSYLSFEDLVVGISPSLHNEAF